ncbi:hypothetical protein ACOME3_003192 [Neoechinorhynchus agilis]
MIMKGTYYAVCTIYDSDFNTLKSIDSVDFVDSLTNVQLGFFPKLTPTCNGVRTPVICCFTSRNGKPITCSNFEVTGVRCDGNTTLFGQSCFSDDLLCRRAECPGNTRPVPLIVRCANKETERSCCTELDPYDPHNCTRFDHSPGIVCEGNTSATGDRCFAADQFCPLTTNVNRNNYRTAVIVPSVLLGLLGLVGLLAGAASLIPLLASARSPRRAPVYRGYRPRYRARLPPRPVPQYVPGAPVGPGSVPRP